MLCAQPVDSSQAIAPHPVDPDTDYESDEAHDL